MKRLFFSLIALFSISMIVPMSFGELYYNNEYSFSVQSPDNWRISEATTANDSIIVGFTDGVEEGSIYSLWESDTGIFLLTDMGEKLSNQEEKNWWATESKKYCKDANYNSHDYRCGSFKLISQTSAKSLDGYPTITTKYTETRQYSDKNVGTTPMVVVDKLIYVGDSIWVITTSTDAPKFSEYEDRIYALMNSFRYPASPPVENSSNQGGGCLIATATYGSELAPQVQQLRELRDNQLLQTESGTAFMNTFNDIYYSISPTIADMQREHPMFKETVKLAITPMITSLSLMENANSESEVLSVGISVIAVNLGMYVAIPAIVIFGIRKIK